MENGHLHDDKLFRAVHDRLSDYEAPSGGANWDAMSRALDNLPKSSGFRWKISLNSIFLILGIVGVSAIGYAVATYTGKPGTPAENAVAKQEQTQTIIPVSNRVSTQPEQQSQPDPNAFANNNSLGITASSTNDFSPAYTETNTGVQFQGERTPDLKNDQGTTINPDGTKKKNKNKFVFGDQIDPKKGFIYGTQENPAITSATVVDPSPNVFYDADNNGNVKKIVIPKKDSAAKGSGKHKADSTAKNSGAPTDGDQTGFDMQGD